MKTACQKIMTALMMICLLLTFISNKISATEGEVLGSIAIQYEIANAEFRLYRIADVNEEFTKYEMVDPYQQYQVSLDDHIEEAALALESYLNRDQLEADAIAVTDKNGYVQFKQLNKGVYLILSDKKIENDTIYKPAPVIVSLPSETVEGDYNFDVITDMKYTKEEVPKEPQLVDLNVMKIWRDKGNEAKRPKSIQVVLLKDGKAYKEQTLNDDNHWQYEWKDLSSEFEWDVIEDEVPKNYTVGKGKTKDTVVLANTFDDSDDSGDDDSGKKPIKAPDSGQLWWPVPILAVGGLLFVTLGIIKRKKEGINEA